MKYPYIRAWGTFVGSKGYYVLDQVALAEKDKAPNDAIYKQDDGTWKKFSDIESSTTRYTVNRIAYQFFDEPLLPNEVK